MRTVLPAETNQRPFIAINQNLTAEQIRLAIARELAQIFFKWPKEMEEKKAETAAAAIADAFLMPADDLIRELGIRRSKVTNDFLITAGKYGISAFLLIRQAKKAGIISKENEKSFYTETGKRGWPKNEPERNPKEEPMLLTQLVYRAVSLQEISVGKGAEILEFSYEKVNQDTAVF